MGMLMSEQLSSGETQAFNLGPARTSSTLPEPEVVADLVRQAKADRAQFEALYRVHVDAVYRFCLRRIGSPENAADLTSQIFIKAFTNIQTCDESRFRSWLFTIARNAVIDEQRSRRDFTSLDDAGELVSNDLSPEASFLANEQRLTVVGLLAFLTEDQRQIVELRLAGLNGAEIASVLGRSRASVDTAQSRAIARLRRVLRNDGGAFPEESNVFGK